MSLEPAPLSRQQALRLVEGAYLAATTGLIWLALYYLPVGGALFRLALPLPLTLLQLRRGGRAGAEGLLLAVLLLTALMGPVRGPLLLFSLWPSVSLVGLELVSRSELVVELGRRNCSGDRRFSGSAPGPLPSCG